MDNLKVLEILSSRICHDLIGPVSAVNNGVEFQQEMSGDDGGDDEAMGLIKHSAEQASYKLQIFRLAYAAGGAESYIKLDEIKASFDKFISELRVNLDWKLPENAYEGELPKGYCKTLLNVMMIGVDMMPKGGTIVVKDTENGPTRSLTVDLVTENLSVNIDYKDALEGKVGADGLTPRTIHPYLTKEFADYYDVSITIDPKDEGLSFILGSEDF